MSQFEKTTHEKALEYANKNGVSHHDLPMFVGGRYSAKESLEILARALQAAHERLASVDYHRASCLTIRDSIAQVKARGDWPLEEA